MSQTTNYLKLAAHLFARLEATGVRIIDDGEGEIWDTLLLAEQFDQLAARTEQKFAPLLPTDSLVTRINAIWETPVDVIREQAGKQ